jgi:hypothetical protein
MNSMTGVVENVFSLIMDEFHVLFAGYLFLLYEGSYYLKLSESDKIIAMGNFVMRILLIDCCNWNVVQLVDFVF